MCITFLSHGANISLNDQYRVVIANNRDEDFGRATRRASIQVPGEFLAAKDMVAGGSWFGVSLKSCKVAVLTNCSTTRRKNSDNEHDTAFPDNTPQPAYTSRGGLVSSFLSCENQESPLEYVERLASSAHQYDGFNLLVGCYKQIESGQESSECEEEKSTQHSTIVTEFYYLTNRYDRPQTREKKSEWVVEEVERQQASWGAQRTARMREDGIVYFQVAAGEPHSVSNALLNTGWPKVQRGKRVFQGILGGASSSPGLAAEPHASPPPLVVGEEIGVSYITGKTERSTDLAGHLVQMLKDMTSVSAHDSTASTRHDVPSSLPANPAYPFSLHSAPVGRRSNAEVHAITARQLLVMLNETDPALDAVHIRVRLINSIFVRALNTGYGTRTNSVLLIDKTGKIILVERDLDTQAMQWSLAVHVIDPFQQLHTVSRYAAE